jgi:hypothetical protein
MSIKRLLVVLLVTLASTCTVSYILLHAKCSHGPGVRVRTICLVPGYSWVLVDYPEKGKPLIRGILK